MKNLSFLILSIFVSISTFAQYGQVKSVGSMSEMGKTGFAPTISTDSLQKYPRIFGMGPLGKMQGEITFANGIPYSGFADLDGNPFIQKNWDIQSPFFVYGEVEEWVAFPLNGVITDMAAMEKLVENTASQNGYDLSQPFFFKLVGTFDEMVTHIVTPRSPEVEGFKPGRNQENYKHQNESGELIGVYSQVGKGIYTPQSSHLHVHLINKEQSFTGHLDKIRTDLKDLTLYLPKSKNPLSFKTNDTDFSKGRLGFQQKIELDDLVKFHGHLCDGLVVGAMGLKEALEVLYPDGTIDRTDLRIVSKSSPCLTDVAVYLTGGRYQFGTFYVDDAIDGMYVVQRISDGMAYQVNLKKGVKPTIIDDMSKKAVNLELSGCELDALKGIEDDFTDYLLKADAKEIFQITEMEDFEWNPVLKADFVKTDVLNKHAANCTIE
ncbi:FmdE family protein [Mongoliitalea lutea]|nr:FmdE family protein [Mongoliitalea lutea]